MSNKWTYKVNVIITINMFENNLQLQALVDV